jgi:putative hydrolase of the HAD superfamily
MPIKAILFDFDDTLAPEAESFTIALRNVARLASERHGLDTDALVASAWELVAKAWRESALFATGAVRGISPHEVFSGAFWEQDIGRDLKAESDRIRPIVWRQALDTYGVRDEKLVELLDAASLEQSTGPHTPYEGAENVVTKFAARFPIGVVTNGDSNIQRTKVRRSGLERRFKAIVVSGDFGLTIAKPDPEPFMKALADLGVEPQEAVMVGNDVVNDIHGATKLGIATVWVNRTGRPFDGPAAPDHEITDLRDLPAALGLSLP